MKITECRINCWRLFVKATSLVISDIVKVNVCRELTFHFINTFSLMKINFDLNGFYTRNFLRLSKRKLDGCFCNDKKGKSLFANDRSSHQRCSIKKAALKNFAIFIGKYFRWSLFLIKI